MLRAQLASSSGPTWNVPTTWCQGECTGYLLRGQQVHADGITAHVHPDCVSSASHTICGAPEASDHHASHPWAGACSFSSGPISVWALLQPHEGQQGPGARSQTTSSMLLVPGPLEAWRLSPLEARWLPASWALHAAGSTQKCVRAGEVGESLVRFRPSDCCSAAGEAPCHATEGAAGDSW